VTVRAPVRLDGVDVGSVSAIRLAGESAVSQRRIELVLRVDKADQSAIRSDSSATLMAEGFLGSAYVNISRGFTGSVIESGEEIPSLPSKVLTLKDSFDFFEKTVDCLRQGTDSGDNKTQAHGTRLQIIGGDQIEFTLSHFDGANQMPGYATSMIGLCQEGKNSPEALGRSAGVNPSGSSARRVGLSQLFWLPEVCVFLPGSKITALVLG
jgi:hypothetical protein